MLTWQRYVDLGLEANPQCDLEVTDVCENPIETVPEVRNKVYASVWSGRRQQVLGD